jgi:hypothetical protein
MCLNSLLNGLSESQNTTKIIDKVSLLVRKKFIIILLMRESMLSRSNIMNKWQIIAKLNWTKVMQKLIFKI